MPRLTRLANQPVRPAPDRPPGQLAAFDRLLASCETDLIALVYTLLPHWPDAEDVVQHTRMVLWQKFDSFEPGSNFRSWAMQVARFEVKNFFRKQQNDKLTFSDELIDSLADVRTTLTEDLEWRRDRLEECMLKLRPSDRRILQHCYGPHATTIREAAKQLSRPVNTLYKALNRIRRTLQDCVSSNRLVG